jgi:hypothetical protein
MTETRVTSLVWNKLEASADPKHGVPCSRSSHGLSIVQNDSRLILYGGEKVARTPIDSSSACWALDMVGEKSSWRSIDCSQGPPERLAHSQAAHGNNVYIFGGRAGITMNEQAMNDLWMLDASGEPGTEKWSQVVPDESKSDPPPETRSFHRMICIGDSLYIFGGCGAEHGRLADLHRFDVIDKTWRNLGASLLRGRGGANLISLSSGKILAAIAGFSGEETSDGHRFELASGKWEENLMVEELQDLRPRSVCVSGSFPSVGVALIFGGEVDPSDRGHEGAGGFENDITVLDEKTGAFKETIKASGSPEGTAWPEARGWSDATSVDDGNGKASLFMFGGLAGDDTNPARLDDLWRLDLKK